MLHSIFYLNKSTDVFSRIYQKKKYSLCNTTPPVSAIVIDALMCKQHFVVAGQGGANLDYYYLIIKCNVCLVKLRSIKVILLN